MTDLAAWRVHIGHHAPGAHGVFVGSILADLAGSDPPTVTMTPANLRRLVDGAHVHPIGLRRILAMFVEAGLLVRLDEDRYAITLPADPRIRAHVVPRRRHHRPHRSTAPGRATIRAAARGGGRRPDQ